MSYGVCSLNASVEVSFSVSLRKVDDGGGGVPMPAATVLTSPGNREGVLILLLFKPLVCLLVSYEIDY